MQYLVAGTNCLILDELTNHLDLPSREQFEDTLKQYPGTLIVASHDCYFRERVCHEEWQLKQGQLSFPKAQESINEKHRLLLETERQYVLGKLSTLPKDDPNYLELDKRFTELTREIQRLLV
ncbi:hypothetical protein [Metasolibacillus meyeri]|uniref:hypothetical protein n=1 Tax=Metasolibacillus meyeri TaxID=1071052 RepID=UPI000D30C7B6|nr:hypothetical protein [Metasolibacillus meyeri]